MWLLFYRHSISFYYSEYLKRFPFITPVFYLKFLKCFLHIGAFSQTPGEMSQSSERHWENKVYGLLYLSENFQL